MPGTSQLIQSKSVMDIIKDEVFDMAKDFIIKSVLSKLKEKYFSFIKENFIDRLLSLFDECFDKIGKTIDFANDQ